MSEFTDPPATEPDWTGHVDWERHSDRLEAAEAALSKSPLEDVSIGSRYDPHRIAPLNERLASRISIGAAACGESSPQRRTLEECPQCSRTAVRGVTCAELGNGACGESAVHAPCA